MFNGMTKRITKFMETMHSLATTVRDLAIMVKENRRALNAVILRQEQILNELAARQDMDLRETIRNPDLLN